MDRGRPAVKLHNMAVDADVLAARVRVPMVRRSLLR
jgi:hypothetical protein